MPPHLAQITQIVSNLTTSLHVLQLWHMGRAAPSDLTGEVPLAPSAIPLTWKVEVADYKKKPAETPKAMDEDDIETTLDDFKRAAENALCASHIHHAKGRG